MTASLILDIAYGIVTKPENDKFVQIAQRGITALNKSGEPNIIDILPWRTPVADLVIYMNICSQRPYILSATCTQLVTRNALEEGGR